MTTSRGMMGLDNPGDKKVPISVRDWNAMKLAMWRSKISWEIVKSRAKDALARCQHSEGCPGEKEETEPCLRNCPDRETRMDMNVILSAAQTASPDVAVKPAEGMYFAPSREGYSQMLVDYETTKMENVALRELVTRLGGVVPAAEELTPKELVATGETQ